MQGPTATSFRHWLPAVALIALLLLSSIQLPAFHVLAVFYLFSGYLEMAAIAMLGVAMLFARRHRRMLGALAAVLAVHLAWPAARDFERNTGPVAGPDLKIITFNWLGNDRDRSDDFAWLNQEKPDILAIQEIAETIPGVKDVLFAMFPYHTDPVEDVIIFSRYPIKQQSSLTIVDRSIVRAELDVEGRKLVVWGIHPSTLKAQSELDARNFYLSTVAERLTPERAALLVLGDFNATRWDPYFQSVVRHGELHEAPTLFPTPTRMAVRSGIPIVGSPIDHILTNQNNRLSDCKVGPALGSDHLPLVCHLTLQK